MKGFSLFDFLKGNQESQPKPSDEEAKDPLIQKSSSQPLTQSNIPYDPKLYPPNIHQSEQHALARRVSFPSHLYERMTSGKSKGGPIDVCDCCGYPVENRLIPICCSNKDLLFLGSGFPLFFEFMKYSIGMLFMIMLIAGLYNISTNIDSEDCSTGLEIHDKPCVRDYFTDTSLVNKALHNDYLHAQEILNLISVLFCILFMHVLRYKQRKLAFECDLSIVTASDYTLQIGNLPENLEEEKLINFLESLPKKNDEPIKVVKVNMSYDINKFVSYLNEQVELSDKLLFLQSIKEHHQNELKECQDEKERKKIQSHLDHLFGLEEKDTTRLKEVETQIEADRQNFKVLCKFTGIAFVTFDTPKQAQIVKSFFKLSALERFKRSIDQKLNRESKFLFDGNAIRALRAPEPNEILWENLGVSDSSRLKWKILNWALTVFCLLLSFIAITMIYYLQMYTNDNSESSSVKKIVSYAGCFVIVIINNVLVVVVTRLTRNEKHENGTNFNTSLTEKKTAALFLNTAVIYLLVAFWNNSFFGSNGLIYNIISVFASNMVMQPLLFLFSPFHLLKIYQQRKMRQNPKAYSITQQQANKIFEGDDFEITVCYAGVLNVMLFGAFYAPLLPLSLFFAIATLGIYYWTFKYILLRRCNTPVVLGKEIAYGAIEIMEFVPLFLAIGDVFFNLIFYNHSGKLAYVTVGISIFNFLFPMGWLNKVILPYEEKKKARNESASNTIPYDEARIDFNEEYDRSNPMTQEKATEKWVRFKEMRSIVEPRKEEAGEDGERKEKVKRGGLKKKKESEDQGKEVIKEVAIASEDELGGLKNYARASKSSRPRGISYTQAKTLKDL